MLQAAPQIIQQDDVLILQNTLYISGKEKDPLTLTPEELEKTKDIIKPYLDVDDPDKERKEFLFYLYKIYYQRDFKDSKEEERRYDLFKNNVRLISKINSEKRSFRVGINKFADREEMEVPKGLLVDSEMIKKSKAGFRFSSEIQTELDHQMGSSLIQKKEDAGEAKKEEESKPEEEVETKEKSQVVETKEKMSNTSTYTGKI